MSIKEQILNDLKSAMKSRDSERLRVLRSLKSKMMEKEIAERKGSKAELSDEQAVEVLVKASKQRKESIEQYREGGRDDLVENEEKELAIIKEYLPEMMDKEAVRQEARKTIEKLGAEGMQDMGKVMGVLMKDLKGKAEGSTVSAVVKEELSGKG